MRTSPRYSTSSNPAAATLGLGRVALAQARHADAVTHLQAALRMGESGPLAPASLDEIRFALARALWGADATTPQARTQARALAEAATFEHGEQAAQRRARRDDWLATHRVSPTSNTRAVAPPSEQP